jgi:hypothetical protein
MPASIAPSQGLDADLGGLVQAHVDVALVHGLGGREHDGDLAHLAGLRALQAAHIGHQGRIGHAIGFGQAHEQLIGVGHLRHRLRRDEAGGLDRAQPGIHQGLDEPQLVVATDRHALVLQPVARTDFVDDQDIVHARRPLQFVEQHLPQFSCQHVGQA